MSKEVILGKGIDSLYLYLNEGLDFVRLHYLADQCEFEEEVVINRRRFLRVKAYTKVHPVALRHGFFTLCINRCSVYIQVASLGFSMRGLAGCLSELYELLDGLFTGATPPDWSSLLFISRLDIFADFLFQERFHLDQFKTQLKAKGYFESGQQQEGKTYYFGNRSLFMARLYVKSAEIEKSGKTYLRAAWKDQGYREGNVWRLEFEYHKQKLDRLISSRQLKHLGEETLISLWSYGMDKLQYMENVASYDNLYKKDLHPIWKKLTDALFVSYRLLPEEVKQANLEYRRKLARRWVLSFYALKAADFSQIPENICQEFFLNEEDYQKFRQQLFYLKKD